MQSHVSHLTFMYGFLFDNGDEATIKAGPYINKNKLIVCYVKINLKP